MQAAGIGDSNIEKFDILTFLNYLIPRHPKLSFFYILKMNYCEYAFKTLFRHMLKLGHCAVGWCKFTQD